MIIRRVVVTMFVITTIVHMAVKTIGIFLQEYKGMTFSKSRGASLQR